jgi:glycyl-tRNA synthetase
VHDWVPTKKFFPTLKQKAKAAEWLMAEAAPYAKEAARAGVTCADWHLRDDEWLLTEKVTKTEPAKEPLHLKLGAETIEVPAECYEIATKEVTVQGRKVVPCVIEPSFGVDRILYALWEHAHEAGEKNGEPYVRLRLSPKVAPVQVGVLPLTGKDGLPEKAEALEWTLRQAGFATDRDESGNIGRRYARQDEVGTPFCVTVDNESLVDQAVTVRERDTTEQKRVSIAGLVAHLRKALG